MSADSPEHSVKIGVGYRLMDGEKGWKQKTEGKGYSPGPLDAQR